MFKLSVPVNMRTMSDETMPIYLEWFQKCRAERVFLCGFGDLCTEDSVLHKDPERVRKAIDFYRSYGYEVGVWVNSFGHGMVLSHDAREYDDQKYISLQGVMEDTVIEAKCPSDKNFVTDYCAAIKKLAKLGPDLIMLDDDFRMNVRSYYMGCFCPNHLEEFYQRVGERIPREEIEERVFTGGKNKYRDAYMAMMRDSLLGFAKALRDAVDEVDETIRLGASSGPDNVDYNGTDLLTIARTFAGKTKPFTRIIGAPYWRWNLTHQIEDIRMMSHWYENQGVEIFTEGDVYPRPRYNVTSKSLELYDFMLCADGTSDGILKYMFDYTQKPDYETGYADMHVRKLPIRDGILELFQGKRAIGVRTFCVEHKIENWVFPGKCPDQIAKRLARHGYRNTASKLLSQNGIPSSYDVTNYPVLVCGENARYIVEEDLANGAILDAVGARILMERGIDTGLLEERSVKLNGEYFQEEQDTIRGFKDVDTKELVCKETIHVLSTFETADTPAAYLYENAKGQRFYVLAHDLFMSEECPNYFNNYYRQSQMIDAIEWLCGKKLPATCKKHPNLYILASTDGEAMSVAMANIFQDEIFDPVVQLDREYESIRFVNCKGRLERDKVYLEDIPSYGFVAFEVK